MKKWITSVLLLALVTCTLTAVAATMIPSTLTRSFNLQKSTINNPSVPGISPTTGLPSNNNVYMPILTQIDNNLGAIPQWGISLADIMYELPIQGQGWTRLTALFSDQYPEEAGPVRSGRVMHADLREEWDAVLVFFGKQIAEGSDMNKALKDYGANKRKLAIDGIGNEYQDYLVRVRYHPAPHNVSAYIKNLRDLVMKQGYQFPLRPFLFTDEKDYSGIEAKQINVVHKGNKDTSSTFTFDEALNGYHRFTQKGEYHDYLNPTEVLTYSNVIVQRSKLTFNNHSMNPLLPDVIGSGAADIFIAGQYIAGAWSRENMASRTVFYDQNGSELVLQRGKTWIIICDVTSNIAIGDIDSKTHDSLYTDVLEDEDGVQTITSNYTAPFAVAVLERKSPIKEESLIIATEEINVNNQTQPPLVEDGKTAIVRVKNKGLLNMRLSDSGESKIILRIPNSSEVAVLDKGKDWTQVSYEHKIGFVMTKYLDFSK